MKNIVILYSGGLDSLLMEKLARRDYPGSNVTRAILQSWSR
jgi:PP-loop superfamily ATP-utilizing enzyme